MQHCYGIHLAFLKPFTRRTELCNPFRRCTVERGTDGVQRVKGCLGGVTGPHSLSDMGIGLHMSNDGFCTVGCGWIRGGGLCKFERVCLTFGRVLDKRTPGKFGKIR